MPCYHPLKGYRSKFVNPDTGKRSVVFNPREGFYDLPQQVPCGQCIGCRLEYSRQWAMRCAHEASLYEDNCFITLTYNPDNLPGGYCEDCTEYYWNNPKKGEEKHMERFHAVGSICPIAPV